MLTREFVSYMLKRIGGLSLTPQELLVSLNQLQNEILGEDCALMKVTPDPFITTVAGTFEYTASDVIHSSIGGVSGSLVGDVRRVSRIYTDSNPTGIFGYYGSRGSRSPMDADFNCIDSKGPGLEDCQIIFDEHTNPGDTETSWKAEVYLWPTQILTFNDSITIPAQFHTTLLKFGLLKDIEQAEYGKEGDPRELYEHYLAEFKGQSTQMKRMNNIDTTPPREF